MPKKVKKSKAQLEEERLLAEEAERKAKELDDKRLADEAEKQRLETLRINAERVEFRKAELERLLLEYNDIEDMKKSFNQQLLAEEAKEAAKLEWLKYVEPSDEPDASSEKDINTFMSLITENPVQDFKDVLELTKRVENVAKSVEAIWADSVTKIDNNARSQAEDYMRQFSNLILEKVDLATSHLLRFSDMHVNPDRHELQVEESANGLAIGLWASFADIRPLRKSVQFEKLHVQIDIPKQILQHDARFIHRVIRTPIETASYLAYHPDSMTIQRGRTERYVVGDLLIMDILRPPPTSFTLRAKKWTIRDRSAQSLTLQRSPYPSSVACKCQFKIPQSLFMTDDTTVALWDENEKQWTEDGVTDFHFSENSRHVQFSTTAVGVFALVKYRTSGLPYKSWSLQPIRSVSDAVGTSVTSKNGPYYEQHARFTIQTQHERVIIDIVGTKSRLIEPNVSQTADMIGVDWSTGALLRQLQRRGINLFPTAMEASRCEQIAKPNKYTALEETVLGEMARCAAALDFQSTDWSGSLSHSQVALLVRETAAYTGGDTFDFEAVVAEADKDSISYQHAPNQGELPGSGIKFTVVFGNEYGDKSAYSSEPRPGEVTHLSLTEALSRQVMPEVKYRISRTNVRFQKAVLTLLKVVRPLSLS